jgi:regulatory protein
MMDSEEKELQKAKDTAYRFLAYRPRSKEEVLRKLRSRDFSEKTIQEVVKTLEEYGYIDDTEFASGWTRYRLKNRPVGKRRLKSELREKGISSGVIEKALSDSYKKDEFEVAKELAAKKVLAYRGLEKKVIQRRLYGFLTRRGFSFETSRNVVFDILKDPD